MPDDDALNLSIDHYFSPENSDLQFDDTIFHSESRQPCSEEAEEDVDLFVPSDEDEDLSLPDVFTSVEETEENLEVSSVVEDETVIENDNVRALLSNAVPNHDRIAIVSTDSESDIEQETDLSRYMTSTPVSWSPQQLEGETKERRYATSTPISWTEQKIDCNKVQDVGKALDAIHERMPHLQPVEGRVYDMGPILQSVAKDKKSEASEYSLRVKERVDYKRLNSHGKGN